MAKRFTDTEKFNDKWYRTLPLLQKVIWEYLLAECNHAGILENFDLELMSFKIGAPISLDDFKIFDDRVIFISDEVLYIPKFIKFQYGELNPQNKVHASVLRELESRGLLAPTKPLASPCQGAKDKDKDKDKEKNKERNKEEKKENLTKEKKEEIEHKFYGEYKNVGLTDNQHQKLIALTQSSKAVENIIQDFGSAIETGKENAFTYDLPNAHFERLKSYWEWRKKHPPKQNAPNREQKLTTYEDFYNFLNGLGNSKHEVQNE